MKSLLITALTFFLSLTLAAQKIPEKIATACNDKFPGLTDIEWEITDNVYKADFSHNDRYKTAKFDQAANWMETRTYIDETDLPESIIQDVENQYEDGYVESTVKIENNKKEIYYEITVNIYEEIHLLAIDQTGKLLKSEVLQNDSSIED